MRTKSHKTIFVIIISLFLGFINLSPAQADELSDAQSTLNTKVAQLTNLQTTLAIANKEISAIEAKISTIDSSTPEGAAEITNLNISLAAYTASKNAVTPQIATLTQEIISLRTRIAELTAIMNAGKNCPTEWGLNVSSLAIGIDQGKYQFNSKVLNEIVADPKSVVVSTVFQLARDGVSWKEVASLSSYSWTNAANWYRNSNYVQTWWSDPWASLQYLNSKVRSITTINKEGCSTQQFISDAVVFGPTAVSFSKVSISDLYSQYPAAFTNYLMRDQASAAVLKIKTDFVAAITNGNSYNYNMGFGNFSITINPLSGSCVGGIGQVSVSINATCEMGIYWLYSGTIKLVDSISATGGASLAQKEALALQSRLNSLLPNVQAAWDSFNKSMQKNSEFSQYCEDPTQMDSNAKNTLSSLIGEFTNYMYQAKDYYAQIQSILNSQYLTGEIKNAAMQPFAYSNKMLSSSAIVDSLSTCLKNASSIDVNQLSNVSAAFNYAKKQQSIANSYYSQAKVLLSRASSINSDVNAQNSLLNEIYSSQKMTYSEISNTKSLISKLISGVKASNSTIANQLAQANDMMQNAISLLSEANNLFMKAAQIVKSKLNEDNSDLASELDNSIGAVAQANSLAKDLFNQYGNLTAYLKARGITSESSPAFNKEQSTLKVLLEKYSMVAQSYQQSLLSSQKLPSGSQASQIQSNYSTAMAQMNSVIAFLKKAQSQMSSAISGTDINIQVIDGEDQNVDGDIKAKKDKQGLYQITISTTLDEQDVIIKATKKKMKSIIFRATTDADGNLIFKTARNLKGYVLNLVIDGITVDKTSTLI